MTQRTLKLSALCAVLLAMAGCSTSQAVNANKEKLASSARAIVGTSLVGAVGATQGDQDKIDETVAGLCGAGVWKASECTKHGQETQ